MCFSPKAIEQSEKACRVLTGFVLSLSLSLISVVVEVEFRVEFVDGLLEVGAVNAVVGADCRRDVFVDVHGIIL